MDSGQISVNFNRADAPGRASAVDKAVSMIRELHVDRNFIPPYQTDTINSCIEEIARLNELNAAFFRHHDTDEVSQDDMALANTRLCVIKRIKRCCCAYLNERLERLKELRWRCAGNIQPEIMANLSEQEKDWLADYNRTLLTYQQSFGESGINLLTAIDPPKSTLIQVKSLSDYGEFETSDGLTVVFKKNTLHLIPRKDSETLVKKGILEFV